MKTLAQTSPVARPAAERRAPRILMIDPDLEAQARFAYLLASHGYEVLAAGSAEAAAPLIAAERLDLIVVEPVLPGEDGLSLCRRLSLADRRPVMVLAARCETMDRILALEIGAEECLGKDCHPLELLARMKVILRRRSSRVQPAEAPSAWTLDAARREVRGPGGAITRLTATECRLLAALLAEPGATLTREQLREVAGARGPTPAGRSIDAMICRLRRKLVPVGAGGTIRSVRGLGYGLVTPAEPG